MERPDGCRLYYELHGDEAAPPLVLLEGFGADISIWRRSLARLADRYRVVAYDLRGNGRSVMPDQPVTMTTLVGDTISLLDHLDVHSAHFYGQSLGGMVAQELAISRPSRVRSLILAATHAGPKRAARPPADANVPKDRPYLALYSEAFTREHPEQIAEDVVLGSQRPQSPHAGRRHWEAMRRWDAWDRIGRIRCPVLVLHGTEDRLIPVENARMLAHRIARAELFLLEGAGHMYQSEQPDAADAAVLAFLDRVESTDPRLVEGEEGGAR